MFIDSKIIEISFIFCRRFYKKNKKHDSNAKEKIYTVYEEGAVNDRRSQKWFARFYAGDSSLNNTSQLDIPDKINSDMAQEITKIFKISKITDITVICYSL